MELFLHAKELFVEVTELVRSCFWIIKLFLELVSCSWSRGTELFLKLTQLLLEQTELFLKLTKLFLEQTEYPCTVVSSHILVAGGRYLCTKGLK